MQDTTTPTNDTSPGVPTDEAEQTPPFVVPGEDLPNRLFPTHRDFIRALTPNQFARLGWVMQRTGITTTQQMWRNYFRTSETNYE
jgi:hypothetical protein